MSGITILTAKVYEKNITIYSRFGASYKGPYLGQPFYFTNQDENSHLEDVLIKT